MKFLFRVRDADCLKILLTGSYRWTGDTRNVFSDILTADFFEVSRHQFGIYETGKCPETTGKRELGILFSFVFEFLILCHRAKGVSCGFDSCVV